MNDYLLHQAVANQKSTFQDIYDIVQSHPRSRRVIDRENKLPVHHAISLGKNASFEIIEYLIEIYEQGVQHLIEHGRSCLHLAILYHCSPPIIAILLNVFPNAAFIKTKLLEQTPLHYACRYGASIDIVRILTNANRELLKEEDSTGRLPLHVALRNRCSQSVVNWIVRKDPTACTISDKCGFHPAAIAVLATCRLPALRLVLQTWEGALLEVTRDGDSLMHIACSAAQPSTLKYLLHIGISCDLLNHKGMKPHQCLPRRPRKADPSKSTLGADRNTILNCLVQITKARRSWNPMTHQLFPPEFRKVSKILALFSLRFEQTHVVLDDGRLKLPFQHILKMMDRTWFDTPGKMERLKHLQPHLYKGSFGQMPSYESSTTIGKDGKIIDVFADRKRKRQLMMKVRTLSKKMNIDIFRIATKRVVVALDQDADQTEDVIQKMNVIRKQKEDRIIHAKKMARHRKEALMLKNMAKFMAERTTGVFVHPLDLMNQEAKEEEERRELARQGLMPLGAKLSGRAWYEFLGPNNIGVNELFYEQLLRENKRMEKEFMKEISVLHEYDHENKMHSDALMDAEWQLEVDKKEVEHIFGSVEEYFLDVDEEKKEIEKEKKLQQWQQYVTSVGGEQEFEYVDHIENQGSPKIVQQHIDRRLKKEKKEEKILIDAWNDIESEMSEEETLMRMLGIIGEEKNEWNLDDDVDGEEKFDGWEWEGEISEDNDEGNGCERRK